MSDKQPAPPDWVNDVPARYGPDWPEERRCQFVFSFPVDYRGRCVQFRRCGYPTHDGAALCSFHCGSKGDQSHLRDEIRWAVSEGAYLGESRLEGTSLWGLTLSEATLWFTNLSNAHLYLAKLPGADLSFAGLSGANLQMANLSDARLRGASITLDTMLDGVTWWDDDKRRCLWKWLHVHEASLRDEREAQSRDDLRACEHLCRRIKRCYQESGQHDEAGRFFVREMECKRKQLPRWSLMRAVYHVLHFVSDYFENPWRVVVIGLLAILLFAFLHAGMGFVWATGKGVPAGGQDIGGTAITLNPFAGDWVAMGRALYFSAITFTATGYGDYVPAEGWGQFIAALESLIGVFLMATFLVCLARKFGRA